VSQDLNDKVITYLRRLENADWAGARAMCAETASVWHNDGTGDQTIEENITAMKGQIDAIVSMRYDVIRQFAQPSEILQQHVLNVAMKNGMRGQVHAAAYFRFDDGLITRIEEYASFAPMDNDTAAMNAERSAAEEVSR
jgi:limonene-1,2-epoxide hydrolase